MRYYKINKTLISEQNIREIRLHPTQLDFDCMDNKTLVVRHPKAEILLDVIIREIEHGTKVIDIDMLRGVNIEG